MPHPRKSDINRHLKSLKRWCPSAERSTPGTRFSPSEVLEFMSIMMLTWLQLYGVFLHGLLTQLGLFIKEHIRQLLLFKLSYLVKQTLEAFIGVFMPSQASLNILNGQKRYI